MRLAGLTLTVALCWVSLGAAGRAEASAATCAPTVPTRVARPAATPSPAGFNYGGAGLRVQLGWPKGTLAAGILPDGGSRATVEADGTIDCGESKPDAGQWSSDLCHAGAVADPSEIAEQSDSVCAKIAANLGACEPESIPTLCGIGALTANRLRSAEKPSSLRW